MQISAQSFVLDLLSAVGGKPIPVRAMVNAAALFDVTENSLRVSVARLVAKNKIISNQRGRYELSATARPVQQHVASWTHAEQRMTRWQGAWIGVHTASANAKKRSLVRRSQRALGFFGFRQLDQALWIRPDNLKGGIALVRTRLGELGLSPGAIVFAVSELDGTTDQRARKLWDGRAIERGYAASCKQLAASEKRLQRLSQERAMVEYFVVGGRAIKQAVFDPLLPEPIVSTAARCKLIDTLRSYDQAGRRCWRDFMRDHDAPALAPVSFRVMGRIA